MTIVSAELTKDQSGRLLRLQPPCRRFSCGGFQLSFPSFTTAMVPAGAHMAPINLALMDGRLKDVTDTIGQEMDKIGRELEVKELGNDGLKTFMARTDKGLYVIIPRDAGHQADIEAYLAEHGELPPPDPEQIQTDYTGLGPLVELPVEPEPVAIILTDPD